MTVKNIKEEGKNVWQKGKNILLQIKNCSEKMAQSTADSLS